MIYLFFIHIALIVFIALYIIKIIQNKYLSNLLKAHFRNAYTDGFFATLENQMDEVLEEAVKKL